MSNCNCCGVDHACGCVGIYEYRVSNGKGLASYLLSRWICNDPILTPIPASTCDVGKIITPILVNMNGTIVSPVRNPVDLTGGHIATDFFLLINPGNNFFLIVTIGGDKYFTKPTDVVGGYRKVMYNSFQFIPPNTTGLSFYNYLNSIWNGGNFDISNSTISQISGQSNIGFGTNITSGLYVLETASVSFDPRFGINVAGVRPQLKEHMRWWQYVNMDVVSSQTIKSSMGSSFRLAIYDIDFVCGGDTTASYVRKTWNDLIFLPGIPGPGPAVPGGLGFFNASLDISVTCIKEDASDYYDTNDEFGALPKRPNFIIMRFINPNPNVGFYDYIPGTIISQVARDTNELYGSYPVWRSNNGFTRFEFGVFTADEYRCRLTYYNAILNQTFVFYGNPKECATVGGACADGGDFDTVEECVADYKLNHPYWSLGTITLDKGDIYHYSVGDNDFATYPMIVL